MKETISPRGVWPSKLATLKLACVLSILPFDSDVFASEICGPKVIAERFVEIKEDGWFNQEQAFKSGGRVLLKTDYRHTGAKDDGHYHRLEFFDSSNQLIKKQAFPKTENHWRIRGVFATDNTLIDTGADEERIIKYDRYGNLINSHGSDYLGDLDISEPSLTLQDGSLLLLGMQKDKAIAAKLDEDKGIVWKASFKDDWMSFYLMKARELDDGSIIVIGNGMVRKADDSTLDQTRAIRLSRSGEVVWEKHYTNGFDDGLSDVVSLSDGSLMFAGHSRLGDRYKDNKRHLWLFKTDMNGDMLEERLIYTSEHAVGTDSGTLKPHPSGEVLASWAIWGPGMHDLQHQECTYIFESAETYRSPK